MILLLDANVLLGDPMCDGKVWDVLAHAPEPWKLRVLVTEVVLEETVARYEDNVSSAIDELRKLTKGWGRLGLGEAGSSAEVVGQVAIAHYRAHLCDSLSAARAEVIPPADVPHMQLVARAVARRRPCDDEGDGYRDTLNWLTVLEMAQANENETFAWVSRDKDFWNDSNNGFHEDLVEDLQSVGALGRVRLIKDLWDAVLELAAEFSSDAEDMAALGHELQEQTVLKFLESSLSENLEQFHLNARAVGLPLETQGVVVRSIDGLDELTYELKGGVAEGEAVAGFAVTAQVGVTVALPVEAAVDYPPDQIVSTYDGTALVGVRKPLVFRGVLQLGRYDRPLGVETTSIEAKPEDAGLALWRLLDRHESGRPKRDVGFQSDLIGKFLAQSGGMKNMRVQSDLISKALAQSGGMKNVGVQSDLIGKALAQSGVMKNMGVQSALISKALAQSGGMKKLGVQSDLIGQFLEELRRSGGLRGFGESAPGKSGATSQEDEPDHDVEEDEDG